MSERSSAEGAAGGRLDERAGDAGTSAFLFRAGHDLRARLRAIHTQAELLLKDPDIPARSSASERLALIVESAHQIDLLADGLSSYSLALQIQENSFQPAQMEVLLRLVLARLDRELRQHDATVTYGPLPRVSGDPDRLSQIFENLILNAVRHRGSLAPQIRITAEARSGEWLFAVRDNGPGMEGIYVERIFRPFERLSGRNSPGPGLGLTICRTIVEKHGGRIWAESTPEGGSTFFFTLPAAGESILASIP